MATLQDGVQNSIHRVLIIGQAGVGKSSLVNLLTNTIKAEVSDSAIGCTFEYQTYKAHYQSKKFELIDTVGLNESTKGKVPPATALKKLVKFIRENKQGFNCILIAMKKGRIDKAFEDNHTLFCKSLLKQEIPVLLYIGHCEEDDPMDIWIKNPKNMMALSPYEFKQCICGTTKEGGRFANELEPLRNVTYNNLWKAIIDEMLPEPFTMDTGLNILQQTWNIVCGFMGFRKWKIVSNAFTEFLNYLRGIGLTEQEIQEINTEIH